jgi:fungal STAND N-terminal Goodbye domain
MSSTQPTSSTSNFQLIIDAMADYAKITGIDLSKNPFAALLEQSDSPEAILQLLQGREKAFKEYRDGNPKLITCLGPAVKVLQAFSGILGEAVSLVSHSFHLVSAYSKPDVVRSPSRLQRLCSLGSMFSSLYVPWISSSNNSLLMYEYAALYSRLPVGFYQATTPFSTCSSAWGISSSAWRSIRRSRPLR